MRSCLLAASLALACTSAAQSAPPKTAVPRALPIQEGLVDANGVAIYYKTVGEGTPLMILHGGPGASHDYFLPNVYLLARHNRLIFIDERGSGRSPKLDDPHQYTVENMVEDVEAVRQALGLGKISLLGHSFGGILAQAYALKYQQNLTHLILADTIASAKAAREVLAHMKSRMEPAVRYRLEELERAGLFGRGKPWERNRYPDEYAKLASGDAYFPYLYVERPDPNYDPASANTSTSWEVFREMWGSSGEFVIDGNLKSFEYLDRLSSLKVPTLVLVGDHDFLDSDIARAMQSRIAGAKLVIFPNSGHETFVDQPETFAKAIDDFLNVRH